MNIQTISDLRYALQTHAAGYAGKRHDPHTIAMVWNTFQSNRRMRKYTRRQRGGAAYALSGAPLNYALTPGSAFTTNPAVAVYDRFPIDPTVNPQVVSDLDVFFGSALSRGCGVENTSLQVPADMGSNQVGGKRTRRNRSNRSRHRKHGGSSSLTPGILNKMSDFGNNTVHHPYMASAYPNMAQSLTNQWQGKLDTIPTSSDPTDHTWKYSADFTREPINVRQLATDISLFAPSYHTGGRKRSTRKGRKGARKQSRR